MHTCVTKVYVKKGIIYLQTFAFLGLSEVCDCGIF